MTPPVPPWSGRRMVDTVAEQKRRHRHRRSPCILCGQPIDYDAAPDDPMRFSVQHIIPRSVRPDLTWDPKNMGPSHMLCNKSQGAKTQTPLGVTSRDW